MQVSTPGPIEALFDSLVSLFKRETQDEAPRKALLLDVPDESERVVSWVREYRRRNGHDPKIREVQEAFDLPKTTAWRRIASA